jgi:hypothetical protein
VQDATAALDAERKDVEKRIARIVDAIATGGEMTTLVGKLRQLEARRGATDERARALHPVPRLAPKVIEDRLAEWRRLLRVSTTTGRTVLQRVLRGRLTFTPRADGLGYDFSGPTRFDKLFTGIVVDNTPDRPSFIDPNDRTGTENIGPEDTGEADYGRLLERVYEKSGKGWCALQDSNFSARGAAERRNELGTAGRGHLANGEMVRPAGLEPATSWFVARRSIQLS